MVRTKNTLYMMDTPFSTKEPRTIMGRLAIALGLIGGIALLGHSNATKSAEISEVQECQEPVNPYPESSTGHHAGFEWASGYGGDCDNSSRSFTEGCKEFHAQQEEYETCKGKRK